MKNFLKVNPVGLLFTLVVAMMVGLVYQLNVWAVFGLLVVVGVFTHSTAPQHSLFMGLQKEIWQGDIVKNLFKDNAFANKGAYNADQFVLAGKVVHIPVAGAPAVVKKNLNVFPATAVKRADTEMTYAIDTYYSLPRQIEEIEKYELAYDKRQSVVGEDEKQLIQDAMQGLLYRWAPAAANERVIETVGANTNNDLIDGATGPRKLFTKDAFKAVVKKLANNDLANANVYALLTANHYYQFIESLSEAEKTDVGRVYDAKTGVVGQYMGVTIMMRSSVLRYRKVATVWTVVDTQAEDYAAAAGDSSASLFWADGCVERAVGSVKVFEDNDNPLYYGDIFSALVRLGGRIRRPAGVYAVVDAIPA